MSLPILGPPPICSNDRREHRKRLQSKLDSFSVDFHIVKEVKVGRELACMNPQFGGRVANNVQYQYSEEQIAELVVATKLQDNYSLLDIRKHHNEKVGLQLTAWTSTIKAGTIVTEYDGSKFLASQLTRRQWKNDSIVTLLEFKGAWIGSSVLVVPEGEGSVAKFASGLRREEQHKANCFLFVSEGKDRVRRIYLRVLRDILPGEPLLWYYGDDFPSHTFVSVEELHQYEVPKPKLRRSCSFVVPMRKKVKNNV